MSAFTRNQVERFLFEAPDDEYLPTKVNISCEKQSIFIISQVITNFFTLFKQVALIFGIHGALRCKRLFSIQTNDVQDTGTRVIVTVPATKCNCAVSFVVEGNFYEVVRRYINARPDQVANSKFFLNFRNGVYTRSAIGEAKLARMPRVIASYLNLENPEEYTSQSFRRSFRHFIL